MTRLRRFSARVRMVDRRINSRPLGQTREQRGFRQRKLSRRFAEVKLRRGFEAVHSMAEEDLIGIECEDLRFGKAPLDLDRKHRLLHLAMKRTIGRKKQDCAPTAWSGRGALHPAAGLDVAIRRSHDSPEVNAGMPVKILVLNRNQRVPQDRGKIIVARNHAPLQRK